MKETFEKKTVKRTPEAPASKLGTTPKSSHICPITAAVVAAVCAVTAVGKTANAEPVTWKIGTPFGDDINSVLCKGLKNPGGTSNEIFVHGDQPDKFLMTFIKEALVNSETCDSKPTAHQAWFEVDDGANGSDVVIRQLGKAQMVSGLSRHIPYCIDGQQYDVTTSDDQIFVNGEPKWNPYPYPDGLESMTTADGLDSGAVPGKIKIYASPFFPYGDWLNYDSYGETWRVDVLEGNYYDAIQKSIDKAFAQGKNVYEAGLTNPFEDLSLLQASAETDKLLAVTNAGVYPDYKTSTYFFSGNSSINQYKPLQRDNVGTWSLEDPSINDGFGEADYIFYNSDYENDNTPEAAINAITPEGKKIHIFTAPALRAIVLQEQADGTFTEPEIIMEENLNADTSEESILCVSSIPTPEGDKGSEQVEVSMTVEQPVVAEIPAIAEQPNIVETTPTSAEESIIATAEQPAVAEIPSIVEKPAIAESMPDVISNPEADAGSSAEEITQEITIPAPPADVDSPDTTAEIEQKSDSISTDETDIIFGADTDIENSAEEIGHDIATDEGVEASADEQTGVPELHDASGSHDEPIVPKNDTVISGKDTLQGSDALVAPDTIQSPQEKDSGKSSGCNCNTVNGSGNSAPVTSISALILALASRLRRKSFPATDR